MVIVMPSQRDNVVHISDHSTEAREAVLERLFAEHRLAVRDFLRVRTGLGDEVDDVVQEVFVRLAKQSDLICKVNGTAGSARAYLFTMANNLVIDMQRRSVLQRNYAQTKQGDGSDSVVEVSPERQVQGAQDLAVVKRAILQLTPKCRSVFLLSRYEALNYRQIAEHMGLSVKQVEKYMSQALKKVRDAARRASR